MFDQQPLDEISDEQIISLIEDRAVESQALEFKATYGLVDDSAKSEALVDIASFANASGGLLIIGIRESGEGVASSLDPVDDPHRMAQQLRDLSTQYIAERIEGLEIESRNTHQLKAVLVRIPGSARRPHMVTFKNQTTFKARYGSTKREMSIGEIRDAVAFDTNGRRLDQIETAITDISRRLNESEERSELRNQIEESPTAILRATKPETVSTIMSERFVKQIQQTPYFRASVTPVKLRRDLFDLNSQSIRDVIANPPKNRQGGWNMHFLGGGIRSIATGVSNGTRDDDYLEAHSNGHMEFWTPVNEHFCYRQTDEEFAREPRLYPYPVVEYPVSFARLAWSLLRMSDYHGDVDVQIEYRNISGHVLRPSIPQAMLFDYHKSEPFPKPHLVLPERHSIDEEPDEVMHSILQTMYASFGLDTLDTPFYQQGTGFVIG